MQNNYQNRPQTAQQTQEHDQDSRRSSHQQGRQVQDVRQGRVPVENEQVKQSQLEEVINSTLEAIVGMFKKELKKRDVRINDFEGRLEQIENEVMKWVNVGGKGSNAPQVVNRNSQATNGGVTQAQVQDQNGKDRSQSTQDTSNEIRMSENNYWQNNDIEIVKKQQPKSSIRPNTNPNRDILPDQNQQSDKENIQQNDDQQFSMTPTSQNINNAKVNQNVESEKDREVVRAKGTQSLEDVKETPQKDVKLYECKHCSRSFNDKALEKHAKICQKVFSNLDKKKDEDKYSPKTAIKNSENNDNKGWKKQSDQLRIAMKVSRKEKGFEDTVVPELSQDLKECPHCNRTFNPSAAAKHIPFCANKSKREDQKRNVKPQKSNQGRPSTADYNTLKSKTNFK